MKLTDEHVSEKRIDWMIGGLELQAWSMTYKVAEDFINALLELKHRRAEDRFNEQAKVETIKQE